MNSITVFLVIACALIGLALGKTVDILLAPPFLAAAVIIALSLKMANAWQKFVVLRAGKLQSVKGPGLFLIFPIYRQRGGGHRRAHPDHCIQCRAGTDQGHRAGQRRRNHFLARP